LNILLTDNKKIQKLNKRFLNRDEPTDVISFGTKRAFPAFRNLKGFLGDIVISAQMAKYNSKLFKTTFENEIFLYVIHGILHLLGYEDKPTRKKRFLQKRQNEILKAVRRRLYAED
ncbi:MAG: rRNA maturation RNase YbeY, partial [Candidatus Omnitrophica bacterium]|nr:rRNA maturation RNase YbeY [Candidatus Omnitrophota bacterium]